MSWHRDTQNWQSQTICQSWFHRCLQWCQKLGLAKETLPCGAKYFAPCGAANCAVFFVSTSSVAAATGQPCSLQAWCPLISIRDHSDNQLWILQVSMCSRSILAHVAGFPQRSSCPYEWPASIMSARCGYVVVTRGLACHISITSYGTYLLSVMVFGFVFYISHDTKMYKKEN